MTGATRPTVAGEAMRRCAWTLMVASLLLDPAAARALELGGHELPERVEVAGKRLALNGAGIRQKMVFKIYVCALYLEERSSDPRAILESNRAWQLTMHFMRDVGHHQLLESFTDAFERNNSPQQLASLRDDLERFHEVLNDLHKGEDLWIAYVPETGTMLHSPSGAMAVVPGRRLADALLRTWIGDRPSDEELKARLLGT